MEKSFDEVMGNCIYRVEVKIKGHSLTHVNHCDYHRDDCEETCCPAMANPERVQQRNGVYTPSFHLYLI